MNEEMTLNIVYNAVPVAAKIGAMPLPAKTAYRASKLFKKLRSEYKSIEEARLVLYKKYGTLNQKNGSYSIPDETAEVFTKEMEELMETKCTIDFQPLTIEMFEGTNLTPGEIMNLGPFMIEKDIVPAV